jgi:hypothetical protein
MHNYSLAGAALGAVTLMLSGTHANTQEAPVAIPSGFFAFLTGFQEIWRAGGGGDGANLFARQRQAYYEPQQKRWHNQL